MSVFRDERVRQALQSAIMDEILIDAPGTYRVIVPDKLIDRLEAILTSIDPWTDEFIAEFWPGQDPADIRRQRDALLAEMQARG